MVWFNGKVHMYQHDTCGIISREKKNKTFGTASGFREFKCHIISGWMVTFRLNEVHVFIRYWSFTMGPWPSFHSQDSHHLCLNLCIYYLPNSQVENTWCFCWYPTCPVQKSTTKKTSFRRHNETTFLSAPAWHRNCWSPSPAPMGVLKKTEEDWVQRLNF